MLRRLKYFLLLLVAMGNYSLLAHEQPAAKPSLIRFTENKNQWESFIKYRAQLDGGALFLQNNRLTYHFYDKDAYRSGHANFKAKPKDVKASWFHVNFVNANPGLAYRSVSPAPDYNNYFIGRDPSHWAGNVKNYGEVVYENIWEGIQLQLIGQDNSMKSNFYVAAGADPSAIQLEYEGVKKIQLKNGRLTISSHINEITEHEPYAYQLIDGQKKEVPCRFKLEKNILRYEFPDGYDKSKELVIDPVLVFACSSGSTADNFGMTATYDEEGNLYSGGTAFDIGFPTTAGAYDLTFSSVVQYGQTDVVITKYDSSGTFLRYSTYLGGSGDAEVINSLIVDAQDNLYVYGVTASPDFPTTAGAYDQTFNGGQTVRYYYNGAFFEHGTDIYISKLNSTGSSLLSSTFMGGSANDGLNYTVDSTFIGSLSPYGNIYQPNYDSLFFNYGDQNRGEIQLDNAGNVVVASTTRSSDFPMVSGFDNTLGGVQDAVVFKLSANLDVLTWSTFFGGSSMDAGHALCIDNNNNVFFTGGSCSNDLTITTGAYKPLYGGGKADGYIAKIRYDGTQLLHSTYIGTPNYDQCYFVQLDNSANVFVFGQTQGTMTVVNAVYSNTNGRQFISKLDSTLTTLLMQTKFGNGAPIVNISPSAFLVDCAENIYLSGWGGNIITGPATNGMPLTSNAYQSTTDGYNFYLMVLSKNAGALLYATYFGGPLSHEHVDGGTSRFDKKGIIYQSVCAGCGNHDDFPVTPGSWPTSLYGSDWNQSTNCNNGTFKFNFEYAIPVAQITTSTITGCAPLTVNFTNSSISAVQYLWDFGSNDTTSIILNPVHTFNSPGTFTVTLLAKNSACFNVWDTAYTIITVFPKPNALATDSLHACTNTWDFDSQSTISAGTISYLWNFGDSGTSSNPSDTHTYSSSGTYPVSLIVTSDKGCKDTASLTVQNILTPDSISGSGSYCQNMVTPVQLTATGGTTYSWSPATGLNNATIANPIATPATTTVYSVTISENDIMGHVCPSTLTANVTVFPAPDAQATATAQPCSNAFDFANTSTLSAGTMSYTWDFGDDSTSVAQSPSHTYPIGSYTVSLHVISDMGCIDSIFLPVQTVLTPDTANGGTSYCANAVSPAQFTASGGTSYSWSPATGLNNASIANPIASPAVSTVYTVTVSENDLLGNTCSSTHTLAITVFPAPDAQASAVIQPCTGTFNFNNLSTVASGTMSYAWDFDDGFGSALASPAHTYSANGSYTVSLHVTSDHGCLDSMSIPLQNMLTPDLASGNAVYCGDSIVPVQLTASGGTSYSWAPAAGLNNPAIANPIASPTVSTTYSVTISETDFGGNVCSSTQTIDITVYPTVTANFTYSINACGNTVAFTNSSTGTVSAWSWNFGDSFGSSMQDPNHSYTTPGTYPVSLAVQNTFGCTDTIVKPLTLAGFNPIGISATQTMCYNQPVQLNASGGIAYNWAPAATLSNSHIPNPTANPAVSTTYTVTITTLNSLGDTCYSDLSTTVNVATLTAAQLATFANPDTIYEGESSQINSNIGSPFTIQWSPSYGLSGTHAYDPVATPLHTTTYSAIATNSSGCQYLLDSVTIWVLTRQCDDGIIFIPNTFSPNADGSNDMLFVRSNFITDLYFAVYDRWGERVFETNDITKGWDGMFKGMKSDPGVFGYYLKYTCNNGQESFKKGNVTLIR